MRTSDLEWTSLSTCHWSSLKLLTADVVAEDEVGVEYLDPAVACVHHVYFALSAHGEAAGLDKALLSCGNKQIVKPSRYTNFTFFFHFYLEFVEN